MADTTETTPTTTEPEIVNITEDGGITKKIIKKGEGWKTPTTNCEVTVHYVGTLLNGTKFDSSRDRNDPFKFTLGIGQVIKGWDKGVASMHKGEIAVLTCTSEYAYGKSGSPPKIPADATLQFEVELISWTDGEKDISEKKDGGIVKKITKNGDGWETPKDDAKVRAKLTGRVQDGDAFESERILEAIVGEGVFNYMSSLNITEQIHPTLETAITSMKKGEISEFLLTPAYAKGIQGAPADVPVVYTIELEDFEKEKESWDMDTQEKLDVASKRKEEGNALFKQAKYARALKKYKRALSFVDSDYGAKEEEKAGLRQMKLLLHNNIAACGVQTKDRAIIMENCNKALEVDANSVKALVRRGKVYADTDEWDKARNDFNKAIAADGNNADAKKELAALNKKISDQNAKDKKTYAGMFEKLSKA